MSWLAQAAKKVVSVTRTQEPRRAFVLLVLTVVLIVGLVGWFVTSRSSGDDIETAGTAQQAPEQTTTTVGTTTTTPTTTTTTLPPPTTTTLSEEEQAEQDVIDAYMAGTEVLKGAFAEPVDPDPPELEDYFVGGALNEARNALETLVVNGWASRFPEDSVFDVAIEVVGFGNVDGVEEAYVVVCVVTDEETYWVETGEPVPHMGGVRSGDLEVVMRKVDGSWKSADAPPSEAEEGTMGCALE